MSKKSKDYMAEELVTGILENFNFKKEKQEQEDKKEYVNPGSIVDWETEDVNFEEGLIYYRKTNQIKRKFFEQFFGWTPDGNVCYWRPKIKDISFCEEKRWFAANYKIKQFAKIMPIFDKVRGKKFSYIRESTRSEHGFMWMNLEATRGGVSCNYIKEGINPYELPADAYPVNQELGNEWEHYEKRSKEIRFRTSLFELLFDRALKNRYEKKFYDDSFFKKQIIINGRSYIIGEKSDRQFGVICFPEELNTEVIS